MATYPNEIWPADASIEALDGTIDVATGLPYVAKGTGPTSVPSYEVQYNRRLARQNAILTAWRQGMVVDEGGLTIGVYPLAYTLGGARRTFLGATGVSVPDDSVRVVYLDAAALLVLAEVWPADITSYLPLASVTAASGALTIEDARSWTAFHVPSLEASQVRDRHLVNVNRASIGSSQSDLEVFRLEPREDLELEEVQCWCGSVSVSASIDVKAGGMSILAAPVSPVGLTIVKPTIVTPALAHSDDLSVHVTTDATGTISDLAVTLLLETEAGS